MYFDVQVTVDAKVTNTIRVNATNLALAQSKALEIIKSGRHTWDLDDPIVDEDTVEIVD